MLLQSQDGQISASNNAWLYTQQPRTKYSVQKCHEQRSRHVGVYCSLAQRCLFPVKDLHAETALCSDRLLEEFETDTSIDKALQMDMTNFAPSVCGCKVQLNCADEVQKPYQNCCILLQSAPEVSSLNSSRQQASDQHGDGQLRCEIASSA